LKDVVIGRKNAVQVWGFKTWLGFVNVLLGTSENFVKEVLVGALDCISLS